MKFLWNFLRLCLSGISKLFVVFPLEERLSQRKRKELIIRGIHMEIRNKENQSSRKGLKVSKYLHFKAQMLEKKRDFIGTLVDSSFQPNRYLLLLFSKQQITGCEMKHIVLRRL